MPEIREQWFWGDQQVGDVRGKFIISACDKEHALARMMIFSAENSQFHLNSDNPDEYFEPYVQEMSEAESRYYDVVRRDQHRPVVLFLLVEPVPLHDPTTAVGYMSPR